ncbi:MAG: sporulation integral membrane protein YtvI [Oscillospiraceae bacterium]|nr:sporulation integral membrane protein YtvI [Oscillospiraceae bacterium]MDD4414421.1 sporulation integral membrane protein YtvI [Oscillospiraceae bacterium]
MISKDSSSQSSPLQYNKKVERRFCFLINLLYFSVLLFIGIIIIRYLLVWMLPFVMAFIVAAALQRPLGWLVRKTKISKKVFSVVLVVLFVLLLAGVVAIITWQLIIALMKFLSDQNNISLVEKTVMGISDYIKELIVSFSNLLSEEATLSLQQSINSFSSSIIGFITGFFTDLAASIATTVTTRLPMLLISFIIWVVASIFLTIDYQKVMSFFMRQVPKRHTETVEFTRSLFTDTLFKLVRAYILIIFITFIELSISFSILNIRYSILLAALIAILDILPVLGTGTVLIPWAITALLMGNVRMFIGLGLTYIIITIIRNIIEPRLVSYQIGLNPLVTLFFMFLGLRAIGVFGMILFPVIVMVLVQLQNSGKIRLWK